MFPTDFRAAVRAADHHHGIVAAILRAAGEPELDPLRAGSRDDLDADRRRLLAHAGRIAARPVIDGGDLLAIRALQAHADLLGQRIAFADALDTRTIPALIQPGNDADVLALAANL
jgi:hypothetical protein